MEKLTCNVTDMIVAVCGHCRQTYTEDARSEGRGWLSKSREEQSCCLGPVSAAGSEALW